LQKRFSAFLVVWTQTIVAPEYQEFIDENNLSVVFLQGSPVGKSLKFFKLMKKKGVTHIFNFLLINNFVGGVFGRLAGVKQIFGGIRNCDIVPSKFRWQKFLHNYISHKTIFNNCTGAENLSLRGFRKDKMLVIHNGIDLDGFPKKEKHEEWPVILTVSRFLPQKDHYTALRTIAELVQRCRKFTYVLVGYGAQEEEIRQWIRQLKLQDYVHLLVAPPDIPQLFSRASIYLSTSLREGLSNSLMEAMAAGLPVVATNVGDNKYLIDDGENGFLTDVGDFMALADDLSRLLEDESLRRIMGKMGYDKIKSSFSSHSFLDNYMKLIDR
jgi:glycosyltransferase involved in cell wall biosynthesis